MNILVVDDDEDTAVLLSMLLEREGWEVTAVPSIAAARSALEREPYAVLVTDLHLEDGSGISLLMEPPRHKPPVALVVTGVDDEAQREACRKVGFQRCLTKPLSGSEIVTTIRSLVAQGETR